MIGDLLFKALSGNRLTPGELSKVRLWANNTENLNSFTADLQTPEGVVSNTRLSLPFDPIHSKVLVEDTASLTLQLPSKYKHILAFGQGRANGSGGQNSLVLYATFNSDTGSNYVFGRLYHLGATVAAEQDTSGPSIRVAAFTADGYGDANNPGMFVLFMPHYRSEFYKTLICLNMANFVPGVFGAFREGVWKNTAPATSITFSLDTATYPSAKMEAGSIFSVYGIE